MSAPLAPLSGFVAVGFGAAVGAWLRWGLGLLLNPLFLLIPLGTLAANLLGGLIMGASLAWIHAVPEMSPAVRLLLTTGFLGGLTTFSTFSAESLHLMQRGEWFWLVLHTFVHVLGALFMAWAGYTAFNAWRG
ncbi:fluoride efflux transporter CrcB [Azoarcus sp. KH32C]|uniref:fluoride efflux transporter CrcB n=1 Tax=Azoarcus sp. KH32C TaxID=748247 RepID=UPI00034D380F|nr:fluoride efflux transporter CrcB [Azoarcus sp. KH32C]